MYKTLVSCIIVAMMLSVLPGYAISEETDKPFKVLWDPAGVFVAAWNPSSGHFKDMGRELLKMGAEIKDLKSYQVYRDELLEDIDLVIICLRMTHTQASEQEALVRYVRNGGSLLVMCKYYDTIAAINPVLTNFAIEAVPTISAVEHLDVFNHPATTKRRPVTDVILNDPRMITVRQKAKGIAGWSQSTSPPAGMKEVIFAMGSMTGEGRVIVTTGSNVWLSLPPVCGFPFWGYGDNTELFFNVIEYLRGASDLKLKKLTCKKAVPLGGQFKIKARVTNLEVDYNRESKITFYLSRDKEFQPVQDVSLGSTEIPPIKGKRSKLIKFNATIPGSFPVRDWYIIGVVNPDGDWLEINESNNTLLRKITVY
ncbi:MAG TPA: CARDB domain-containing protein [Acidobacteriota bacterium]|nr:CARDB domain-containing protein [Acidobacteriota bacterium]